MNTHAPHEESVAVRPARPAPPPAPDWSTLSPELVRTLQRTAGNAATARALQRMKDEKGEPVDIEAIDSLGAAKDALWKLDHGVYTEEVGDRDALGNRIGELRGTLKEQTAKSTVDTMDALNQGRVMYHHNAVAHHNDLLGTLDDPANGYANPAFFTRTKPFTWTLNERKSASQALRAFLEPGPGITVVECQTAAQAALYNSILRAVGDQRFDRRFGRADQATAEVERLKLQKDMDRNNPLMTYLEAPTLDVSDDDEANELTQDLQGNVVSAPGDRPARVGGWYYLANHPKYSLRHPDGIWGGENAIYIGRDGNQVQRFTGFGVENKTETELAVFFATDFRRPPSAAEITKILNRSPGDWSLVLPTLGDLASIGELVLTERDVELIERAWSFEREQPGLEGDRLAQAREKLRRIIVSRGNLVQPVTPQDLLKTISVSRSVNTPSPGPAVTAEGTWTAPTKGAVTLTLGNAKKLSLYSYTDLYCKQFGLRLAGQLVSAVRGLNQATFGAVSEKSGVPLKQGDTVSFPNTDDVSKLAITGGGFQSWGEQLLSPDKIGELADTNVG
ncbi:hypothetical protein OJ997_05215 [Solirubrobacter phytolaccae]|uniref:Uncharacterized protein n=1 Tax=Solirubrobacter phytolaccae TaxID=1404360 RepID=A0A9X3N563_9ACTN|nr:hypothetical protein [Solirubrobacter phytolaccae]MDA0179686.1 hypothetical protein [Solirubrobacter phytolaccae]